MHVYFILMYLDSRKSHLCSTLAFLFHFNEGSVAFFPIQIMTLCHRYRHRSFHAEHILDEIDDIISTLEYR